MTFTKFLNEKKSTVLWSLLGIFLTSLLVVRAVFPEYLWLSVVVAVLLIVNLGFLIQENKASLRSRGAAYGLNSAITIVLVIGIVSVLNFLIAQYPLKKDLTKNKLHTLSDQTEKVVKGLQKDVKVVFYSKSNEAESLKPLLENYVGLNKRFEVEYIDPDRQQIRAKEAGIRKYNTLHLKIGTKESKVEDPNEEKITNALIKLFKDKSSTLCAVTGHGEKSFASDEADGYALAKKTLEKQSYEVKDLSLIQESKIPDTCDAVAILGPTKAFLPPEVAILKNYLENGGRGILALDINPSGGEYTPELLPILADWYVKPRSEVIIDPVSKLLGVDAVVPIVASYSKIHSITRDFQPNCAFPFARPLDVVPYAPPGMTTQWIAQTTPKSWSIGDFKQLSSGQVRFTEGRDKSGPFTVAVSVEGKQKDSKSAKGTRMIIFSSSSFANNNYARFGGNLDFFMNSISWTLEDESMISIRPKEDENNKIEISEKLGMTIFLLSVVLMPLSISAGGIVNWVRRKKL